VLYLYPRAANVSSSAVNSLSKTGTSFALSTDVTAFSATDFLRMAEAVLAFLSCATLIVFVWFVVQLAGKWSSGRSWDAVKRQSWDEEGTAAI